MTERKEDEPTIEPVLSTNRNKVEETGDRPRYHFMVVVLGDLGRSPRMQYHVLSLLQAGHFVTFIGYSGEELVPPVVKYETTTLQVVRFPAPSKWDVVLRSNSLPLFLYFVWKSFRLMVLLVSALLSVKPAPHVFSGGKPKAVLLQNPPAIPALLIMVLYKYWTGARLIIDWHNLGYSMVDKQHKVFRAWGRWYEQSLAPFADGHLTVTKALLKFLKSDLNVRHENCSVLYDCPPSIFRLRTVSEQHQVLAKHHAELLQALATHQISDWPELGLLPNTGATMFTEPLPGRPGKFQPRSQRPALLVSSTSWTKDEDLGILINALQLVDDQIQKTKSSLRIICAITGKGLLKAHYEKVISELKWKSVVVLTLWIEPADYPTFLATADIGISLHTSSSGMDLPIKILDYFGCEVPVCAYKFSCLHELVQDDVNGRTFEKPDELATILLELLEPLGNAKAEERLGNHAFAALERYSLQIQGQLLWSENWPKNAWPVLERALEGSPATREHDPAQTADKSKDE